MGGGETNVNPFGAWGQLPRTQPAKEGKGKEVPPHPQLPETAFPMAPQACLPGGGLSPDSGKITGRYWKILEGAGYGKELQKCPRR